jgi:hypothetical protein
MPKAIGDGSVIDVGFDVDEKDQQIESLRTEVRQLKRALGDAQVEAERAREDANRALSMLRRQLGPLYRALQAVFGELDAAGVADVPNAAPALNGAAPAADTRLQSVWASWKTKLGGTVAKGIDALLLHGELDTQQLAIAAGVDKRTVTNTIVYKLHGAGLINKNGGRFSLKQL